VPVTDLYRPVTLCYILVYASTEGVLLIRRRVFQNSYRINSQLGSLAAVTVRHHEAFLIPGI